MPKGPYIKEPCEERAQWGTLRLAFIRDLLDRYWYVATVTTEENDRLASREMPPGWQGRAAEAGSEPVLRAARTAKDRAASC